MVNMKEVFAQQRIINLDMDRVPLDGKERDVNLLRKGDLLFARQSLVLSGAGKCVLFQSDTEDVTFESHIIRCRLDPRKAVSAFYFYFFRSAHGRSLVESIVEQVAAAGIRGSDLGRLVVPVPPLAEQQAVADVLGALDDKIELNRRMNATLEAMARALFQSWFVDFDPVRAKLDGRNPLALDPDTAALFTEHLEDSPLGRIPKGWTAQRLPDAIEVNPRRSLKGGALAPYLDMKNLPTNGHSVGDVIVREFSSGTKFQNGDTLLARITPCLENGKTGYVDFLEDGQVGWGSTEYIVLSPKPPLPPQFGYLLARSDALRTHAIQNMTGTSGRQRVPSECFSSFWLAVPPPAIARRFDEVTAPLMDAIRANCAECSTLATLRDTLLPRLLSGKSKHED
jgi:type I restriction enzyme S subunit